MDFSDYLVHLRTEASRLAAVAELGLDAPVPSCPGWVVSDVVGHTGMVYRHKTTIIRQQITDEPPDTEELPDDGHIAWFLAAADDLVSALENAGPDQTAWTWHEDDQTTGFWARRMAHESVIHRIDVELAHEVVEPIDVDLASDGVDGIITAMMTGYPDWSDVTRTDRTVRLTARDAARRWDMRFITFSGTSTRTGHEFVDEPSLVLEELSNPGAVISASAEELDRYLWGRGPGSTLDVTGDDAMVDIVRDIAADVTQ